MRWYWKRDGRLPHVGNYKRNASSLFYGWQMNYQEEHPNEWSESIAMEQIMDFAY